MNHTHEWLPLDTVRDTFQWLVTGPDPVSVDGREFDGLPPRLIPLDELRDLLMSKHCTNRTRDAVWAYLVHRARTDRDMWMVACAGIALPSLAGTARWLAARYRGDRADIHAAVLTGFIEALAQIDLSETGIVIRLTWAARRAGQAALEESLDAPLPVDTDVDTDGGAILAPAPQGHPELVVARAVGDGVLTRTEADLISATRFGDTTITAWARAQGRSVKAVYKTRDRAEDRLLPWLREQIADTDPQDSTAHAVLTAVAAAAAPVDDAPARSRAVSGRLRNGRPVSTRSASKTAADSGLLGCGETTTCSPRTAPESEVRRCA